MRFDGLWLPCDDGAIRPLFRGEILANDGKWHDFELLWTPVQIALSFVRHYSGHYDFQQLPATDRSAESAD